jgi:hypothetical protein
MNPLSDGGGTEKRPQGWKKAACETKKTNQFDPISIHQSHLADLRHAVRLENVLDLSLDVAEAEGLR